MDFLAAQVADQTRIEWNWSHARSKNNEPYHPTVESKWWFHWAEERIETAGWNNHITHVGRIMETDLGMQLFDTERCTACRLDGTECWVYSDRARPQVRHPGSAYTRCRAKGPMSRGCSVATRRSAKKRVEEPCPSGPQPKIRKLLPQPSTNWNKNC